ncbi:torulene oxygenase [Sarocladium strictum]
MAAINASGIIHRLPSQEAEDSLQSTNNIISPSREPWPNSSGFETPEHRGPISLTVKGSIPSFAAGALYRTGPGRNRLDGLPNGKIHYVSHWFDGFAHTHKFDIKKDGSVEYSSRRNGDEYAERVRKKGWRSAITVGQKSDPCVGMFAKTMSFFQPMPRSELDFNVVVNANMPGLSRREKEAQEAVTLGHQRTGTRNIFISSDQSGLQELHPDTLESVGFTGQNHLHKDLQGQLSASHGQRDPKTGDLYNFNLKLGPTPTYRVFRTDAATAKTEILATIFGQDAPPAYVHSTFLTENYFVLALPSTHFGMNGIKIVWERTLLDAMVPFTKDQLTQWFIVDRRHGKGVVARFTSPAGFFFHSINAFEETFTDENGEQRTAILADFSAYDSPDIMHSFYYDVMLNREDSFTKFWNDKTRRENSLASIRRFRFPLPARSAKTPTWTYSKTDKVESAELVLSIPNPHAGELPSINPLYATKPTRYVYSLAYRGLGTLMDCIVKTDLQTREAIIWSGPSGSQPGEPVFVPRPSDGKGEGDEDDGVLLSVVLDGANERSFLLCLDAKTLEELGRAEVEFAIGLGFHGVHLPEA